MKKIIVDVENTTTKLTDKYMDYSPYNPGNKLVSIGWGNPDDILNDASAVNYLFLAHKDLNNVKLIDNEKYPYQLLLQQFADDLKQAEVVIAHNAKYDIQWLEEAGFDLSHLKVEDTMIREYVMARGRSDFSFRLADTCKRYGVAEKGELFEKYPDMTIDQMPIDEVEEYGRADIQACAELYLAQENRLSQPSYEGLRLTITMMEEFCRVLATIERNGVKIDDEALQRVELDFTDEAEKLKHDLYLLVKKYMGDTPVNLESPQQLSQVIYSRRIKAGQEDNWIKVFNIGKDDRNKNLKRPKMSYTNYADHVKAMTEHVLRTEVKQCKDCLGVGKIQRLKKDGSPWKKNTLCKSCVGTGAIYTDLNEVAGFRMKPMNINFTTISGFSTGQTFLDELIEQAKENNKTEAVLFLEKLQRLSSVSSYLSNFVGGIKAFKQADNILHPNFNQCITATGRLSSTKPNLQNQPREQTFPIRKVFVSRWKDGLICETDFAQLEFRAAVHLAQCQKGKQDILNGIDIHNQTKTIITEAGQPISRQEAKSRTFKPLYGGTSGTDAEREYYKKFLKEIYIGIYAWHKELQEEALKKFIVTLPTGRQYIFPDVERAWHGGATKATQICNYPVQGFATADIVPISIIRLAKEFKARNLNSKIVLTVHDSVISDTHPDEKDVVIELMKNLGKYAEEELKIRYNIDAFVPFDVEVKIGTSAMELRKVA